MAPIPSRALPFTDVVQSTVQPLEKKAHVETIDATFMDLLCADSFVPILFAYRLTDKSDAAYSQLVERIKASLQKVLIPFFSFAGRWIAYPTGSNGRRLLCNDDGVPFREAYVDRDLDSVVQASTAFQPVPELQGYGAVGLDITQFKQQMPPDADGSFPSIFVQITRFKCGGVTLAVTFNHMHTDAKGFFNFMTAWSDISRTHKTVVTVDHCRAQAEVPSLRALIPDTANPPPAVKLPLWVMNALEVEGETIRSLKKEAAAKKEGVGFVSTGDCIVGQLWRSWATLPSPLHGGKEPTLTLTVEGRTRFHEPPLPDLCGNAVSILFPPEIPASELMEMPLASIASRLRNGLEATPKEEWIGLETWMTVFDVLGSDKFAWLAITSWFGFPLYEMDFGFGKPYFAVGLNSSYSVNGLGMVYIGPPIPNTSSVASVHMWASPDTLRAFESDPHFLSFFHTHQKN